MNHSRHTVPGRRISGPLRPHAEAFAAYLAERRYAASTTKSYLSCVEHFSYWLGKHQLEVAYLDASRIQDFLDSHLPACDCPWPVVRTYIDVRAALGHLLVVLRQAGSLSMTPAHVTPVDQELSQFDQYMDRVRGLAPRTRKHMASIVRGFLHERFGDGPVAIGAVTPKDVRQFFADRSRRYSKPVHAGVVVSALRGYFRFRATRGDAVHHLIGAVAYPANWQRASLPQALSSDEIRSLVDALGQPGRSMRRADAIVRCALDLGLRSGEIASIALDDIDWHAGTITLPRTKARRMHVLPLPAATGQAIADYLQHERPKAVCRAIFVRHITPLGEPVGPDAIRKIIRQAYARAGLPYTRSHLLRHTMANRLLEQGSSLKEVADVLRHRSLNTTLIYAKLDSRNLRAVALPWPECRS